jgi:carbonic anhydrase/acetyltransferase-like protein (isoleucine patch superfamily)
MSIKQLASQYGFSVVARSDAETGTKKYKLTEKTRNISGKTLYRIVALDDIKVNAFLTVHEGELGGFIEGEHNLSQTGNAWVDGSACVFDKAVVSGKAWVHGEAQISENAHVEGTSQVRGKAIVKGKSVVKGDSQIYGKAVIEGASTLVDVVAGGSVNIDGLKLKDATIKTDTDLKKYAKA